jgi:hypothetical protein
MQGMKQNLILTTIFNLMTNIIGMSSRAGGLTTYIATLAYHSHHQVKSKKVDNCHIVPVNPDANSLQNHYRDVFTYNNQFHATRLFDRDYLKDYFFYPFYAFDIKFKTRSFFSKSQNVEFTIQDLPNEIFENIEKLLKDSQYSGLFFEGLQEYLLVMDGTSYLRDQRYADSIKKLLQSFPDRNNLPRIAFAISKCELPQLWVNRDNPRGMAKNLFPKMYAVLENWSNEGNGQVEYFATSAFGVLERGEFLEPNSVIVGQEEWGTMAFIKNFNECQPFGLVEPLYWLCTGKHF